METESEIKQKSKAEWFAIYSDASALSVPLGGLKMRLFNVFAFYKLGACLGGLRLIGSLEGELAHKVMIAAKWQLQKLREEKLASLEILSLPASGIKVDIDEARKMLGEGSHVHEEDAERIINSVNEFEAVLEAQTPREHTYTVEQLRGFSMPILVDRAEENFPKSAILSIGDEALKDIQQAGRCLAFELPTAAGIHMMRAFEKVFRRYYKSVTGSDPARTDLRTLIQNLNKRPDADPKTLHIVDQIRDLHRNPLAHTVFLEMDEAVELFDIAKSAITAMAKHTYINP
jgi:hypothetical protein